MKAVSISMPSVLVIFEIKCALVNKLKIAEEKH